MPSIRSNQIQNAKQGARALRKLQMHTIAPKGYRKAQVGSYLSADVLCHPKSSLKARARANGNGVEVGGRGERSKPWGAGIVIRKHYLRLSLVCGLGIPGRKNCRNCSRI